MLILTAIVVGVATAALALALVVRIHAACDSVEEDVVERVLHQATGPVEAWLGDGEEGGGRGGPGRDFVSYPGRSGDGSSAGDAAGLPEDRER